MRASAKSETTTDRTVPVTTRTKDGIGFRAERSMRATFMALSGRLTVEMILTFSQRCPPDGHRRAL